MGSTDVRHGQLTHLAKQAVTRIVPIFDFAAASGLWPVAGYKLRPQLDMASTEKGLAASVRLRQQQRPGTGRE
jgi:hypothetical protein